MKTAPKKKSLWNSPKDAGYSDEWYTPPQFVAAFGKFDLDPCAASKDTGINHATENWRFPEVNGLEREWKGRVWMNPPYSQVTVWVEKLAAHGNGIALLNSWTERMWLATAFQRADGILFPRKRVTFIRHGVGLSSGCIGQVVLAFGKRNAAALRKSGIHGSYFNGPAELITSLAE